MAFRCTECPVFFVFTKKILVKYLRFLFLISSFLLIWALPASAKHIIGGELYYVCLGSTNGDPDVKTYQIYMKIYRDCLSSGDLFDSSPGATTTASVSIYQGNDPNSVRVQYLSAPVVSSVDPNPGNECVLVPPEICIEEGFYTFMEVELPVSDEPYHIVYQRCCRNEALTNINNPGVSGATYTIDITPEAQRAENNSPVFDQFPPFIICAGEDFSFDHSATDPDGHRLEYRFCSPYLGGGTNNQMPGAEDGIAPDPDAAPPFEEVDFIGPTYSAQAPLGGNANFAINPQTGVITGVPNQTGQFVVTVCVSEYDENDVLLSEVRRDFQFLVTECERPINIEIASDEQQNDGTFVLNSCTGSGIQIENRSEGQDNVESFFWEFDVNGTPQTYSEWSPVVSFPDAGTYPGTLYVTTASGCMDSAQVSVNVLSGLRAGFAVTDPGCEEGAFQFTDQSQTGSSTDVQYQWDFGDGNTSMAQAPTHTYATPGSRTVRLQLTDGSGCVDSASTQIDYFPVPPGASMQVNRTEVCLPQDVQFSTDLPPLTVDYTVVWDFGDGSTSSEPAPTHTYMAGTYSPSLSVTAPNGCSLEATLGASIVVQTSPTAGFQFSPDPPTSLEPEVTFGNTTEGADNYQWDFGGLGQSTDENPVFMFPDTGAYRVELIATSSNGCTDTASQLLEIIPVVAFYVPNAFSPNNDGRNDVFRGFGPAGGRDGFEFSVFSRWGDRIFYTTNPEQGWDGTHQTSGEPVPQGSYVYYMTFIGPEGERVDKKGLVHLVR